MPQSKKQKTTPDSESEGSGVVSTGHNDATKAGNQDKKEDKEPAPHDYICIYRPFFDVDGANWLEWTNNKAKRLEREELHDQLYKPGLDKEMEANIYKAPASEHKDHKWVMMWDAWLKRDFLCNKSNYCDPDEFGMDMCNDWRGWGVQEIAENVIVEFDQAFRKKTETRLDEMWVIVSAVGLWLNQKDDGIGALINCEDGQTTCELVGLIGCALLTALSAIDRAGLLKPDARFLDLPLVIGYYLELSHDLPAYGIEGECVEWRKEAVAMFKKGKFDADKALSTTSYRLEQLADNGGVHVDSEDKENGEARGQKRKRDQKPKRSESDPWGWAAAFRAYKQGHGPKLGGTKYDITKMSRAARAAKSYDGKDPLAEVPLKALKDNLLDLGHLP